MTQIDNVSGFVVLAEMRPVFWCFVVLCCVLEPCDPAPLDAGLVEEDKVVDAAGLVEEEKVVDAAGNASSVVIDDEDDEEDVGEEGDDFEGDIVLGDAHILDPTVRRIRVH